MDKLRSVLRFSFLVSLTFAGTMAHSAPVLECRFVLKSPVSVKSIKEKAAQLDQRLRVHPTYNKIRQWVYRDIDPQIDHYLVDRHLQLSKKSFSALGVSILGYVFTAIPRFSGYHNFFLDHYSNLFVGTAMVAWIDQMMVATNPRLRNLSTLTSSILFTIANFGFEIYPRQFGTRMDWIDFYSGEVGLILYIAASRVVERLYLERFHSRAN